MFQTAHTKSPVFFCFFTTPVYHFLKLTPYRKRWWCLLRWQVNTFFTRWTRDVCGHCRQWHGCFCRVFKKKLFYSSLPSGLPSDVSRQKGLSSSSKVRLFLRVTLSASSLHSDATMGTKDPCTNSCTDWAHCAMARLCPKTVQFHR